MAKNYALKGLSCEMDLAFEDMHGHIRPKFGTRPVSKLFRCSNGFITQTHVFLAVNATFINEQ
jgi:hypothetical protein